MKYTVTGRKLTKARNQDGKGAASTTSYRTFTNRKDADAYALHLVESDAVHYAEVTPEEGD